jgi:hypothetical protein
MMTGENHLRELRKKIRRPHPIGAQQSRTEQLLRGAIMKGNSRLLTSYGILLALLTLLIVVPVAAATASHPVRHNVKLNPGLQTGAYAAERTLVNLNEGSWKKTSGADPEPDLSASTKDSCCPNARVSSNSLVTYTITLVNEGTIANNVQVTDELGTYYSVHNALDFMESPIGTLSWNGSVANEPVSLRFVAKVEAWDKLPPGDTAVLSNRIQIADGVGAPFDIEDDEPPEVVRELVHLPLLAKDYFPDPYEPNDTPEEAHGPLASRQLYTAYFPRDADRNDYYYLQDVKDTQVEIELTVPQALDLDLWIYDSEQTVIAGSARVGLGRDESVRFTPLQDGRYYVRIYRYQGLSRTDPYTLLPTY